MDTNIKLIHSRLDAPEAAPLVTELGHEYATRYGEYHDVDSPPDTPYEIDMYPPLVFEPPYGDFLLLMRDEQAIAGGAFMYFDDFTAEIKRVWTARKHRRQGHSRTIMAALEDSMIERGYRNAILSTGPRQPEAHGLYLDMGYTPLFDVSADLEEIGDLYFEKELAPHNTGPVITGEQDKNTARQQRRVHAETARYKTPPPYRL